MPSLIERVREKLKPTYTAPWAVKQYRDALTALLDPHGAGPSSFAGSIVCRHCSTGATQPSEEESWPCWTVRTIARELGVEVGDA